MNGGDPGNARGATAATTEFLALLQSSSVTQAKLASLLDSYDQRARVAATRGLPRRMQRRLYDAVASGAPLTLEDFVPAFMPPYEPVRHFGTNTLPAHRCFEKVMYRLPDGRVGGRNVQSLAWLTGHGYFVVELSDDRQQGDVQINYNALPGGAPAGWPRMRHNRRGLSMLVYGGMVDYMRRVSAHVTIGRAVRAGKPMDAHFLLVRDRAIESRAGRPEVSAPVADVA